MKNKPVLEDIVDPSSNYNLAKSILRYKDFVRLLNQKDLNVNQVDDSSELFGEPIPIKPETKHPGHTLGDHETHIRHRKIHYAFHEDVATADYQVDPVTGRKSRAGRVTFNLKYDPMGRQVYDDEEEEEKQPVTESKIDDITDEELDKMAASIKDIDDILNVYDEDELEVIDPRTGKPVEIKEDLSCLDEVLSRAERMKVKIRFARSEPRRERKLLIALRKHSDSATLSKRARHMAINMLKERIIGKPVSQMSVAERERAEAILSQRKMIVNRLAIKLVPQIKKIELERLTHSPASK